MELIIGYKMPYTASQVCNNKESRMEKIETSQQPNNNVWKTGLHVLKIAFTLVCLVLICAGIIGYGFAYPKEPTDHFEYLDNITSPKNLANLIAYGLVNGLIIWGIFYVLVIRKRGAIIKGFSFIAIFICLETSSFFEFIQHSREAMLAHSEVQKLYSEFIKSSVDSQGMPKLIEKTIDTTPKAHGKFGEMEKFMKELLNQLVSQRNGYLLEVEAIGWDSLLDINHIKADKTFVESKVKIQKAKELVEKYKKQSDIFTVKTQENIRSLNINERKIREMLSGLVQGMEEEKKSTDTLWTLESKTIDELENCINLLSEKKGTWDIEGEHIVFHNDDDQEKIKSYVSAIQQIERQKEDIYRQRTQALKRSLDMKQIQG